MERTATKYTDRTPSVQCPRWNYGEDVASDDGSSVADADGSSLADAEGSALADSDALDDGSADAAALAEGRGGSVGIGVGSGMNRDGTPATDSAMISTKMPMTVRIHGRASRSSRVGSDPR